MGEWFNGRWKWKLNDMIPDDFSGLSSYIADLESFLTDFSHTTEAVDQIIWKGTPSNSFSVHNCYGILH